MRYPRQVRAVLFAASAMVALPQSAASVEPSASSTAPPDAIEQRRLEQSEKIAAGRKDGGITWGERRALAREQRRIATLAYRAASDGEITPEERAVIQSAQDTADRHIAWQRQNPRVRGLWWRMTGR